MDLAVRPLPPEVVTESIVVIDIVDSTKTINLFGWYAVGRQLLRDLRTLITDVCMPHGLRCLKSTGDGYLLTFYDPQAAERSAIHAVDAVFELMQRCRERNREVPEERTLNLRAAVHLGEVDVVENDREGPHVSYTFRHEGITRSSLSMAANPISPERLPLHDYALCSEEVSDILTRRSTKWKPESIGYFKLKGFTGYREIFQILPSSGN